MASRSADMDSCAVGRPNRRSRNPAPLHGHFLLKLFSGQSGNHCVIASLVAFVVVTYLTSQYHQKDQELENIKKFLKVMEPMEFQGVDQAEKGCMTKGRDRHSIGTVTVSKPKPRHHDTTPTEKLNNKQLSVIRRLVIPRNSSSNQEITIMSFVYTTSFDKGKSNSNKTKV